MRLTTGRPSICGRHISERHAREEGREAVDAGIGEARRGRHGREGEAGRGWLGGGLSQTRGRRGSLQHAARWRGNRRLEVLLHIISSSGQLSSECLGCLLVLVNAAVGSSVSGCT
jgi:hypothetical protein